MKISIILVNCHDIDILMVIKICHIFLPILLLINIVLFYLRFYINYNLVCLVIHVLVDYFNYSHRLTKNQGQPMKLLIFYYLLFHKMEFFMNK